MTGVIVQVNVSAGGIPKRAVAPAELTEAGIVGDAWRFPFHGGQRKAILLITIEGIDEVVAQGFALVPGSLGENLTTRGLDRRALRLGQRLRAGNRGDSTDADTHTVRNADRVRIRDPGGDL